MKRREVGQTDVIRSPDDMFDHVAPVRADIGHRAQRTGLFASTRQFQSVSYSSQSCE